ncbi:MAG: hypothetical protein ACLT8Y_07710 [Dorea formicigenerans]
MDALNNLKVHFYHVEEDSWQLQNINTPEEYQTLTAKSCSWPFPDLKTPEKPL